MEKTIFKKIIDGEIPCHKIYEDNNHIAFLDIFPFDSGHTLLIPKKEYQTINEIPENEFSELMCVAQKISKHYEKVLNCGINLLTNNKEIAEQEVKHFHIHIVPRTHQNIKIYLPRQFSYKKEGEIEEVLEKLKL